ncbi:MarR family winged helix-turn-helix transcriptional regulator [Microbulbifer bruguierae]|uniref:MarR family winged helix-turn-helix transcriptional regulator n=1 Tax=Microbulbifer bruguierae TaxID=3029061 RepID=A0ABY8NEI4_9GAMM|nr:MarR family winged helix-turn-helix transcriptional regulator [Microbulbifer bruguierae]WGL17333.1 MarR family winged helix-turn-helix transcriptional regulator [Microbulbifer bruguierae]
MTKPVVEPCLALSLRKANRVLTQIYDQDMAANGIKITQFAILRAVYYLGETTNRKLQEVLVLDQTTLSRNLKPLLRDAYLEAHPGQDRREKYLRLSKEGKRLFLQSEKDWQRTQDNLKALLGEKLTERLLSVGQAVVDLKDSAT